MKKIFKKSNVTTIVSIAIILILMAIPTGYEDALIYQGTDRVTAKVLSTNEDSIRSSGLIQYGEQTCEVKLLKGQFKGNVTQAVNMLQGSLDSDKIFSVGDTALVVVSHSAGKVLSVTMIDHYRLPMELLLILAFAMFLILFAGNGGVRAILSFVITVLTIWKVLIPCLLNGINPIGAGIAITIFLTLIIISLVYGFDIRFLSASSGSILGVMATCIMGIIFTNLFKIHGAIMDYSQTLLYSGYEHLNLTAIFKAAIFIGASGAMMDLAVDITSAVDEVVRQVPDITWKGAAKSGFNVGRAAMGTMTTTLLLAYSGGYVMLLMTFMAQGTPVYNILNYNSVSAEILDTLVGSFGLVTVAPFTALTSGFLLTWKKQRKR